MKKIQIKLRSVVYSLVGILVSGVTVILLYMAVPGTPNAKVMLDQFPGGVAQPGDLGEYLENWKDYQVPSETRVYFSEYEKEQSAGKGVSIKGFVLGDNPYHVREKEVADYIARNVFRYGRLNPMAYETEVITPAPTPDKTPEEVPEETAPPATKPNGIVIKADKIDITLEYTSGKLPLAAAQYKVAKPYGLSTGEYHYGLDLEAPGIEGAEVYSVLPGIISNVGHVADGYGNYVVVNHGSVSSLYAQLQDGVPVKVGDRVLSGDVVGYVGKTGNAATPHLHFEMDVKGVRFDPEIFIKQAVPEIN